jgi:hypothetical protein
MNDARLWCSWLQFDAWRNNQLFLSLLQIDSQAKLSDSNFLIKGREYTDEIMR